MTALTRAQPGTATRQILRVGWLVLGLSALGFAIFEVTKHSLGLWPLVPLLAPDLALFVAIGQPHEHGQHPRRAVPLYNLLHQPLLPVMLMVGIVALAMVSRDLALGSAWFTVGVSWLAHIAIDRAAGYGLRRPDGWLRG